MHQKGLRHNTPKPSIHVSKTILPYLQVLDRKWEKVTATNFNPSHYKAHLRFSETARNLLNSKNELEDLYRFYYEDDVSHEVEQDNTPQTPEPMPRFGSTAPDPTAIPETMPIRRELPDSSGLATPQGHQILPQRAVVGQKRPRITSDLSEEQDPACKRCKYCNIDTLHDDYIAKQAAADQAQKKWWAAREAIHGYWLRKEQDGGHE